ncbi:MAG: chaperone NapD [Campylobacterota bacterium]|nr:chaperone NapD [Campylobacterota bacterium]
MNISSIVVQVLPKYMDALIQEFKESDLCDYHLHDESTGKVIVTIEGKDVGEEIAKLVKIQEMPHVIAADMMMTYQEDQLDEEIKVLNEQELVPQVLNDDNINVRDIVYNGDLKNKDLGF